MWMAGRYSCVRRPSMIDSLSQYSISRELSFENPLMLLVVPGRVKTQGLTLIGCSWQGETQGLTLIWKFVLSSGWKLKMSNRVTMMLVHFLLGCVAFRERGVRVFSLAVVCATAAKNKVLSTDSSFLILFLSNETNYSLPGKYDKIFKQNLTLFVWCKISHTNFKVRSHTNSELKASNVTPRFWLSSYYIYVRFFSQVLHMVRYCVFSLQVLLVVVFRSWRKPKASRIWAYGIPTSPALVSVHLWLRVCLVWAQTSPTIFLAWPKNWYTIVVWIIATVQCNFFGKIMWSPFGSIRSQTDI